VTRRNRGSFLPPENWHYWWNYNKDRFLKLKVRLYARDSVHSESAEFFFGRRTQSPAPDTKRPDRAFLKAHVIPQLLRGLEDTAAAVRYRAAVALGKVGTASEMPALIKTLRDKDVRVREGALLGLALMKVMEARPLFLALLEDGKEGKTILGGRNTNDDFRGVAAMGLGLIEKDPDGLSRMALFRHSRLTHGDHHIPMVATIALGLLQGNAQEVHVIVKHLRGLAGEKNRTDEWVRAQAVLAIGRILHRNVFEADPATLNFLTRILDRDRAANMRRCAAIALGYLTRGRGDAKPDAVKVLRRKLVKGKDRLTRSFAAIALGQAGGAAAHQALCEGLLREKSQLKAFCGLGLGILCANLADRKLGDAPLRVKGIQYLRAAFRRARNPDVKGGLAVSLGIARDSTSGPLIFKAMKASRETQFIGDCAVSLGLVGHTNAMEFLRNLLDTTAGRPRLKEHAAIGLGLMGLRNAVPPLLASLKTARNHHALVAVTQALGFVGDKSAVPPLMALLDARKHPTHIRAYASWALGTIGDPRTLPALTPIRSNHNYLASCGTFNHLLSLVDM